MTAYCTKLARTPSLTTSTQSGNQTFLKRISGIGPISIKFILYSDKDHDDQQAQYTFLGQYQLEFTPPLHSHDEHKEVVICNKKGKPSKHKRGILLFSIHWIPGYHPPTQLESSSVYHFEGRRKGIVALGPILLFRGTNSNTNEYLISVLALYEGTGGEAPLLANLTLIRM
eukprot:TRINITY_DN3078_c1_g2_i16.p1 TRINITY_DN3078_c1_g2~~TRINITY_DN3078_c1_g2_i16.p1  ORF type:complete len:171 (+),score=28.97 TRINITY_DN3078_c1_g2_i16:184-696(+)